MKKYILILAVATMIAGCGGCGNEVKAQGVVVATMKTSLTSALDSVKVSGGTANYLYVAPTQPYKCASFQSEVRRVTAAMAGTCVLQSSIDASTWTTCTYASEDTLTIANGATDVDKTAIPASAGLADRYYRLKWSNTSTADTIYVKAKFCGRN